MSEVHDWTITESFRSAAEVSSIYLEAARLCFTDSVEFIKNVPARVDSWLADYGDTSD